MLSLSALTIFLLIAVIGFAFLLMSLVFGDVFDSVGLEAEAGFVDSRVVSVFVTAFGGAGSIAIWSGANVVVASIAGVVSGVLLGFLVSLFGKFLHNQQASSSVTTHQLVGRTAQVSVAIPAHGIGQVVCRVGEERVERVARTRDGRAVSHGALVQVDEIAGDALIVTAHGGTIEDASFLDSGKNPDSGKGKENHGL